MKIAIAGTGYVGLSNAVLLAQHNEVKIYRRESCNTKIIFTGRNQ